MVNEKINIIIVEDQDLIQIVIETLLKENPAITLLGIADSGKKALELISEKQPDIVLLDFHLHRKPGPDKFELIREVQTTAPKARIIMLTNEEDPYLLSLMLHAGADSLILKSHITDPGYLCEAIKRTNEGKRRLTKNEELNFEINEAAQERLQFALLLNDTESQVLFFFSEGKPHDDTEKAVKKSSNYIRQILRRVREKHNENSDLKDKENLKTNDDLKRFYQKLFPFHFQENRKNI